MDIFLGEPPANIKAWIVEHYAPGPGPAPSELETPLYFEANEPGASVAMLCLDDYNYEQTTLKCHLQYSVDKMATWSTYDGSIVELDDCMNNRVYFRADPENPNTDGFHKQDCDAGEAWMHYFKTDGSVKAGGNILFLLESTGTRTDVPEDGFSLMFSGPDDNSCASLTTAPLLPATTLAERCYCYMFKDCTSLVLAPALPATTLAERCYCYMFRGCTHLASMDVSFTAWNPSSATTGWVYDAGSEATGTKTFTCPSSLPQTFGEDNIPSGWTVVTK